MIKKLGAIGIIVFIYNLIFFPFKLPSPGRFDFIVFLSVVLAATWLIFWPKNWREKERKASYLSTLSISLALFALFRASPIDNRGLGIASLILASLNFYILALETSIFGGLIEFIVAPIRSAKSWLIQTTKHYLVPQTSTSKAQQQVKDIMKKGPSTNTLKSVARGLIITIPIAFIIVMFLASSDPIFAKLVENIFKDFAPQKIILRSIHTILLILFLIPITSIKIHSSFISPSRHKRWRNFSIEASILISILSTILAIFLFIQFKYLFTTVPETALHEFGINTYSEYVRKGFIELLFVAGFVYIALGVSYITMRLQHKAKAKFLTFLNYILLSELALFIVSIIRRVYLYQSHHGLTRIRIYGLAFVVYFLILTITLALRHFYKNKKPWYLYELGAGLLLMLLTTGIKPDKLIAETFQPTVNNLVDFVHISRLSADAIFGWQEAYFHALSTYKNLPKIETITDDQVRQVLYAKKIVYNLQTKYAHLILRYGTVEEYMLLYTFKDKDLAQKNFDYFSQRGWLETNVAEKSAYKKMGKLIKPEALNILLSKLTEYINQLPQEKKRIPLDRSYESPLL